MGIKNCSVFDASKTTVKGSNHSDIGFLVSLDVIVIFHTMFGFLASLDLSKEVSIILIFPN